MNKELAFPGVDYISQDNKKNPEGMTLRDYFAAKAMQAAITGMATRCETLLYSECAGLAYEMADAMLKERE